MWRLSLAWRATKRYIPEEWWEEVNIVPQKTAMYDDVFVNQEIVKKDDAMTTEEELNKIKETNEYDFYSKLWQVTMTTTLTEYKSQNTVYHMYYQNLD